MLESMSPIYKGVSVETAGWGQTSGKNLFKMINIASVLLFIFLFC
jgi:hypothetical protein